MPAVSTVQFPLNKNMKGIGNKLFFIIKEKLLIITVVLFSPRSSRFQYLENRLQEHTFPAPIHHGDEAICGCLIIMEIKSSIFVLLLHAIILEANNSNAMDFRHAPLPPLISLIF